MFQATVSSKGQVTIPKDIRDQLKLRAGDRIAFLSDAAGTVHILPMTDRIQTLKGCVPAPAKVLTLEEMQAAIVAGATKP